MATTTGLSRTLSCRTKAPGNSSPVEGIIRRTKSVRQTKRDQAEDDALYKSGGEGVHSRSSTLFSVPRLLETPVRLITQTSLSLSLPRLYSRDPVGVPTSASDALKLSDRGVSPPRPDAQLWRSRSVRRSALSPATSAMVRRSVHFHVTSCTSCLSRGTIQCYCNYVPRSDSLRLATDFFTLASAYPRLPEAHTSSRYTSSSALSGSRRRSPSMSSLSNAYGGHYDHRSSSLSRPKSYSNTVSRVGGLLY